MQVVIVSREGLESFLKMYVNSEKELIKRYKMPLKTFYS
jgi:hypothetical protein